MMTLAQVLGLVGQFAIGIALVVLARLSQRLGHVTHVRSYFIGHYVAAGFIWSGMLVRFYFLTRQSQTVRAPTGNLLYILLSDGLPAIGITLGLVVTWYYWSWLLAERD